LQPHRRNKAYTDDKTFHFKNSLLKYNYTGTTLVGYQLVGKYLLIKKYNCYL